MIVNTKNEFLNIFKKTDFVGPLYSLEVDDSTRFRTFSGAIMSTLVMITVLILSILFGKELFLRKQPLITIKQESVIDSIIYLKEFPLIFQFNDLSGKPIDNIFSIISPLITTTTMSKDNKITQINNEVKLVNCRNKQKEFVMFKDYIDQKFASIKGEIYCLDFNKDSHFKNSYYSTDSISYDISFLMPFAYMEKQLNYNFKLDHYIKNDEQYELKKSMNKNDFSHVHKRVEEILLGIHYINSYVDVNRISNPIVTDWDTLNTLFSPYYYKRGYMRFTINNIITDYGYILEEKKSLDYTNLQSYVPDDMLSLTNIDGCAECDGPFIFSLTLESPKFRSSTLRVYMKMQNLFASVGGILNAVIVCSKIISYHYLRFLYVFFLKNLTKVSMVSAKKQIQNFQNKLLTEQSKVNGSEVNVKRRTKNKHDIQTIIQSKYLENIFDISLKDKEKMQTAKHLKRLTEYNPTFQVKNSKKQLNKLNENKYNQESYLNDISNRKLFEPTNSSRYFSKYIKNNDLSVQQLKVNEHKNNNLKFQKSNDQQDSNGKNEQIINNDNVSHHLYSIIELKKIKYDDSFVHSDNPKELNDLNSNSIVDGSLSSRSSHQISNVEFDKKIIYNKKRSKSATSLFKDKDINNTFTLNFRNSNDLSDLKKVDPKYNKEDHIKNNKNLIDNIYNIDNIDVNDLKNNNYKSPNKNISNINEGSFQNESKFLKIDNFKKELEYFNPYLFERLDKEEDFNDNNFGYFDLLKSCCFDRKRYNQYHKQMKLLKQAINFDLMTNMLVTFYSSNLE